LIRIWGRANALNVRKVVWAANEVGVRCERIDAGRGQGVVDTAEYARLNPNRLVPTIDDNGYVLWESNVIVRYLFARYGTDKLYPTDLQARFDAERWMDWAGIDLLRAYRTAFNAYTGNNPSARTAEITQESFDKTNVLLAILDQRLADRPYVMGEHFSMADIPAGAIVDDWMNLGRLVPGLMNLKAWYGRLRERPATVPAFWGNGTISIL
jgi:glutathione S-transferase